MASRARPARVGAAESMRTELGTRRFILLALAGLIAAYYYFFVHHALPVQGLDPKAAAAVTQAPPMPDEPKPKQPKLPDQTVIKLDTVKSTAQRIGWKDTRAPKSAADPAPTIEDILLSVPSDVSCKCIPSVVSKELLASNLSPVALHAAFLHHPNITSINLRLARETMPEPFKSHVLNIERSGNVLRAHRGRVLPTHTIEDEIEAQVRAFDAAQEGLNFNQTWAILRRGGPAAATVKVTVAAAAAPPGIPPPLPGMPVRGRHLKQLRALSQQPVLLELDANLVEQADDSCMEGEECAAMQQESFKPRSLDDLMADFRSMYSEEIAQLAHSPGGNQL